MDLKNKRAANWKHHHFWVSFCHAYQGLKTAWKEERNLRFHSVMTVLVILAALIFRVTMIEWLWLGLSITIVLVCELINTAIENVVDLIVGTQSNQLAKKAKDIAAGAVLIASLFSLVVGLTIFLPYLWHVFFS
ncbi:diacylglycerol kinase family protein [Lactobacillus sp. UCMA15818]|nr:diacylglycerol kinase family protein [Lactobacillus sp. UCMA15818]MDN2452312.1 diacylglycerol kinase family protein [Lactobacillus sp. UCMA15818]